MDEIKANIPKHTEFLLQNTTKQANDEYATYGGAKIIDIFKYLGIDLTGATSFEVAAPDGFLNNVQFGLTAGSVPNNIQVFPPSHFYSGLESGGAMGSCGWVVYPANTYGLLNGQTIPNEMWHIVAYEREGGPLEKAYLDTATGKIAGEGPFRNIIPPWTTGNARWDKPDRMKNPVAPYSSCSDDGYNYSSSKNAHNAGQMAKALVVIRIKPMPVCEEMDYLNEGWAMVENNQIAVYGHNVTEP
jgi:hypothetical protein